MSAFSMRVINRSILTGVAAIALSAGSALAGVNPAPVDMTLDWNGGSGFSNVYDLGTESDDWYYDGDEIVMIGGDEDSGNWRLEWEARTLAATARGGTENVTANIQVFNDTLVTQTYWVLQTKNGVTVGPNSITNGDVSSTLTNVGDVPGEPTGATMANISSGNFAGDPIYQALIDGSAHKNLWENGFSLTATAAQITNSDSDSFAGLPGSGVNDAISVWLKFEVSALDSVNLRGFFEVTAAVPAPATLPALAAFGLMGRRRRRSC